MYIFSPKTLIFSDSFLNDSGGISGWRARIKDVIIDLLAKSIEKHAIASRPSLVLSSSSISERLDFGDSEDIHVRNYDNDLIKCMNQADYRPLHEFAVSLYRFSEAAGPDSGLIYKGLPLLKILECRWLDPLFNTILVYGDIFKAVLEEEHPLSAHILSSSSDIRYLTSEIASAKGISVSRPSSFLTQVLLGLVRLRGTNHFKTYRQMINRELSELPAEAHLATFDGISSHSVLFVGRINRTVERLAALLPALKCRDDFEPCMLASSRVTLLEKLKAAGLVCSYTREWLSANEGHKIVNRIGKMASKGWRRIRSEAARALPHTWHGVPIYKCAESLLEAACLEGNQYAALMAEIAARVVDRCRPSIVVNFEDQDLNRAITLLCQQHGIPTLAYYALSPGNYSGLVRRSQEWMAVSGRWLHENFSTQYPSDKIRIVGDTLADRMKTVSGESTRIAVCNTLGLPPQKPLLVLMSTWVAAAITMNDIRILFERNFQAASQIQDLQVIVKVHPLQSLDSVKRWMASCGICGVLVQDFDLLELCLAADLVSVPMTAAVWIPMLARTPVVCIQPRATIQRFEQLGYDYLKGKGIVYISPEEDPVPIFRKFLFDPSARQAQIERGLAHVEEHMGPLDGNSSQRLIDFMTEIIKTANRRTAE